MMKRIFALFFILCLCVSQSCVKSGDGPFDDDSNLQPDEAIAVELPEADIPLVKSIVTAVAYRDNYNGQEYNPGGIKEQFEYDKKNRIVKYDYNNGNFVFIYKYDVANRVIEVNEWDGIQTIIYHYNYYKDRIVVKSNRDGYSIFLKSDGKIDYTIPYGSSSKTFYVYDDKGNMTGKTYIDTSEWPAYGTHPFDDHKNPFTRVAGSNLHFMYLAAMQSMRETKGNPNNSLFADKRTGVSYGTKTYTYNTEGYPVSSKIVYPDWKLPDTEVYEYTR
jgi:hypothetical protein